MRHIQLESFVGSCRSQLCSLGYCRTPAEVWNRGFSCVGTEVCEEIAIFVEKRLNGGVCSGKLTALKFPVARGCAFLEGQERGFWPVFPCFGVGSITAWSTQASGRGNSDSASVSNFRDSSEPDITRWCNR